MTRIAILASLMIFALGCGPTGDQNALSATNKVDSATYVRPTEEKLGVTTMEDFCKVSGLKPYPGSEAAAGEKFNHGEGVTKSVIVFTTSDSIDKIGAFYKAEGMDVKNPTLPIGATKSGAQVMISISSEQGGKNIVKVTGLVSGKKAP